MRRFIILIACAVTMLGCHKVDDNAENGHAIFAKHFISYFADATTVALRQYDCDDCVFMVWPEEYDYHKNDDYYYTLCDYWGDTSYDRMVQNSPSRTPCYANMFTSVDMVSSADFGDIKAGESLADIVMFRGATARPYIEHGYSNFGYVDEWSYDGEMMNELGNSMHFIIANEFQPVLKRLSELTPDDLALLSCNFMSIRFLEVPEIKEHTLTIIFREGNREVRGVIDVVFP